MARIIDSANLKQKLNGQIEGFAAEQQLWIYNGMDCTVTREVLDSLQPQLDHETAKTYEFERLMCIPAMAMMRRGVLTSSAYRSELVGYFQKRMVKVQNVLDTMARAVWDKGLNYNSSKQLQEFFYDTMMLPPIYVSEKGVRRRSCNREALEQLEIYLYARPFIRAILSLREMKKKLQVLLAGIDEDKRLRTSFNVGATETGRWSSSHNAFGTGDSLHQVTEVIRRLFIADPGHILVSVDLKGAESWGMAGLSGDRKYLAACESGDVHTAAAKMMWPELPWTGDLRLDRELSEEIYYRHFSRRDMTKRGGHATNYIGSAWGIAKKLQIEQQVVAEFQRAYLKLFHGIDEYHTKTSEELVLGEDFGGNRGAPRQLRTPMGRRRTFFGRPWDDATVREAVAYRPQSLISDVLKLGMLWVYQELEPTFQLLQEGHDSILGQVPEARVEELVERALLLMTIPIKFRSGMEFAIPLEASVGYNWSKADPKRKRFKDGNPGGLVDWEDYKSGKATPKRESASLLDQRLSGILQ